MKHTTTLRRLNRSLLASIPVLLATALALPVQARLSVFELNATGSSAPRNFVAFNNKLYFSADDGTHGEELWVSDGTADGTRMFKDIHENEDEEGYSNGSYPSHLTVFNDKLYFSAYNDTTNRKFWVSNGTAEGTLILKDIQVGRSSKFPESYTVFNEKLYFSGSDGINGNELWVSDGTTEGTRMLKDIYQSESSDDDNSSYPNNFTVFNDKLYFSADNGVNGEELWVSDGETEGTKMLKDIYEGESSYFREAWSSSPSGFTVLNNKLYFSARDGTNGDELWASNGTAEGTMIFKDIYEGEAYGSANSSSPTIIAALSGKLYFSAPDDDGNNKLWVSNGTAEGTTLLKDINYHLGRGSDNFAAFNGRLYFRAIDSDYNTALWVSDGTTEGTVILKDISPSNFTVFSDKLYFTASNSNYDDELWVSDGTAAGTIMLMNLTEAPYSISSLSSFTVVSNKLYFSAYPEDEGSELYLLDPLELTTQTPATASTGVSPDTSSLSLTFNEGVMAGTGAVTIYTSNDDAEVASIDVTDSALSFDGQTVTISLGSMELMLNTGYYVKVPGGAVISEDGEAFSGLNRSTSWTFTTGSTDTPINTGIPSIQTISIDPVEDVKIDDGSFTLNTNGGSSGNPLVYTSRTPSVCSVDGTGLVILGPNTGTCSIRVEQAGNDNYRAANPQYISFKVDKHEQILTWVSAPPESAAVGETFTISVTGGDSGKPVKLRSLTRKVCKLSGNTLTTRKTGECRLQADQSGTDTYSAARERRTLIIE